MNMPSQDEETDSLKPSSQLLRYLEKIWSIITKFRFIIIIALLAFWVKVAFTHSIDMWDEGWFSAIASRMAFGPPPSDPWLPLYYPAEGGDIKFFDKPPFTFWVGAFLMLIFGRTTIAVKGVVILGGSGLALVVYFLYNHQIENRSAAVVAGLLVALAHFLTFYSRTAYIDSFVVFMSAVVMLFGIRAVDAIFVENNLRKGYFLLIVTFILNIFNILTKAWQGILTYPAIAIYLTIRYLERHMNLDDLHTIWSEICTRFTVSPKDMEAYQLIQSKYFKEGIPFPYIVGLVAGGASFLGAFFSGQLLVSSIILAVVAAIGCYIVFLRASFEQKSQLRSDGLITAVVTGYLAGFAGNLVVKVFYGRLESSAILFAEALGDEDVLSGFFSGLEEIFSNEILALLTLEIIAALFGLILTFGIVFFFSGVLLDLFNRKSIFLKVIYEGLDLIPLVIIGIWLAYWFAAILLVGQFFDRDALLITQFGVIITLILIPLVTAYPTLKNRITKYFKLGAYLRSTEEVSAFASHLLFLSVAIILIIISFYPFVYWVQYLDANIANGTFPWIVRTPGELSRDPERPDPVTYTFLFFTYYIGWRYSHATNSGDLARSVGSAINDYALIVMLPFFIVGVIAFFFSSKRNPALGSALLAWLITIPFIFFPAQFQLNYYYIPLAIPYLAIAAKGIEYIYSSERWRITVVDNVERFLAGFIFYLEIGYTYLILPFIDFVDTPISLLSGSTSLSHFLEDLDSLGFYLFVAVIYLVPFTIIAFYYLKTFPGVITTGFAYKFFIDSWFKANGLKTLYDVLFHDLLETIFSLDLGWILDVVEHGAPIATLIGVVLLILGLYWLKPQVKPQALIILGLTLSAMLINASVLVHINQIFDVRYQEMAIYIKNHGGDYNFSTWVIPDAGSQFAMRYYLGYEVEDREWRNRFYHIPFSEDDPAKMDAYYEARPHIKFWVVVNNSKHHDVPPYAINYTESYRWLTTHEHLVCVDDIVGLTSWWKIHLFVNRTWITEQNYDWTKLSG
ncbi:MAG: ArnT family glycosyltransferase [Promethearchaeota archaeon]